VGLLPFRRHGLWVSIAHIILGTSIDKKQARTACLMCHERPKNGRFDFCSNDCKNNATLATPLLIEVPQSHATYTMGKPSHSLSYGDRIWPCDLSWKQIYIYVERC